MRTFAFQNWPSFREKRWNYIKEKASAETIECSGNIIAIDNDNSQIEMTRSNAQRAGVHNEITLINDDFFSQMPSSLVNRPGHLILNPPYGKRLSKQKLKSFYYLLGSHIKNHYKGWSVAILFPIENLEKVLGIPGAHYHTLTSGGLKLRLCLAKIRK